MSQARFDIGQAYNWQPLGIFNGGQSVSAGPTALTALNPVPDLLYRVDYAALVLRFLNILDVSAWAELSLSTSTGVYPAFLTVCSPTGGQLTGTVRFPERVGVQLTLPFYVTGLTGIWMRGGSTGTVASNYDATVGISVAHSF